MLKGDAAVPKMDSVPQNTSAYHFNSESDGWAASEGQLFHTTNGGKNWNKVGRPLACAVSGLFFFSEQEGILLGSSEENACVLMRDKMTAERVGTICWQTRTRCPVICLWSSFPLRKACWKALFQQNSVRPAGLPFT